MNLQLLRKHLPYVIGVVLVLVNALIANGDVHLSAHVINLTNAVLAALGLGVLHNRQS